VFLLLAMACTPGSVSFEAPDDSKTPAAPGELLSDDDVERLDGPSSDSAVLFDQSQIPQIGLELSDSSWRSLINDPYEYVEGYFIYEGVRYGPIGVRTKGENSWRPINQKSSLKLDFNRYQDDGGPSRILGLKSLTLQAMNEDYSMMHERMAYWLYAEAGVPAVRANHAEVAINGDHYGLFTVIDTVDDLFLARWFDDNSGSMWEQHDGDYADQYVDDNRYFQHEEGEDDRSGLQWVTDALEEGGPDAVALAGERLDWEAFHRYSAVGSVVMNFDAYPMRYAGDDCHIYDDPTSGKLIYIPHGVDESFYYDEDFEERANGWLAYRCREVPACRDAWADTVYEVLEVAESLDWVGRAEEIAAQIEDAADDDPNRNYSMSNVRAYQGDMISKMRNRRDSIEYYLE